VNLTNIFLNCDLAKYLWSFSSWSLHISSFSSKHISEWILAIIYPISRLGIPIADCRKFQLFATTVLDLIWLLRNKLIHEAIQPNRAIVLQLLKFTLDSHYLAWKALELPSLWTPPCSGFLKCNFDVAIRDNFAVAAAVISNSDGEIILAATQKLSITDALAGEAFAALLTSRLATSVGLENFLLEGDALLVILAVNQPYLFSSWHFAPYISNIRLELFIFQSRNASKVSRYANFRAHVLAKWAATHLVFGSISTGSPILSSIKIKNGNDHSL